MVKAVAAVWMGVAALATYFFLRLGSRQVPGIIQLSEKDSGSSISTKPGMSIVVTLPANGSTGYGWYPATDVFPLGQPEVKTIASGNMPGAPSIETRTYRITPAMIGSHRVQLEYKQAWMKNTLPAKVFSFDATVKSG